ncbi:MAG: Bax inhibitor-1/YccA family protein [Ruminococcus sp.]|nr:Bax inhibitor-1/YccA family protein [Ruminococcus sp.]
MALNQQQRRNSFTNPAISRVNNFDDAYTSQETATYRGVYAKIAYFLALILLGVGAFFYMHHYFAANGYTVASVIAENYVIFANETSIMIGAWIVTLVAGLIAAFVPKTIPVTGSIYCLGMGYALSITSFIYAAQYSGIVVEALVLTVLIIAVMAFLYYSGLVKVGQRFKMIVITALIASCLGGLIFFIISRIAPNSAIVTSIIKLQNGPLGILFAVLGVILGACLLLLDFETIAQAVENGVNKKYEWYCGYSLMLSVIYLYLKVLQLLARIQNNRN